MKIAQINVNYGFGSTGIIVRDLQQLCFDNGIDCEVIYSKKDGKVLQGYSIGNYFTNKLHALLSRIAGKQGYFSFLSTIRLLNHFRVNKPDIIHLHNLHSCYINLPMLLNYIKNENIPVVLTLHDCWFYTGGCCHYTSVACDRWKSKCGCCPKRRHEVNAFLIDGTSSTLSDRYKLFKEINQLYIVGVSQWIVNEAKQSVFKEAFGLAIHNGIDVNFFRHVDSDLRKKLGLEDTFVILAPSNKWFLDDNIDTFNYFASRLTGDMKIVFIGSGCEDNRLTDRMINYGFISSREEIRAVYSMADVMINCTREESLSLLNVEVQSCGTPVVTYSNTGVKETVDGICGFAVENGNPKSMWSKMMLIKQLGKNHFSSACRDWAVKEFDKDSNYKKYLELYLNVYDNHISQFSIKK